MIDALMYGMTPSAKIVICDRLLPENMSYRPNSVLAGLLGQSARSASVLMPGVGMCPPTR